MFRQLKKTLVAIAIASLTLGSIGPAFADSADTLPDMGTSRRKHAVNRSGNADGGLLRPPTAR